MPDNDFRAAPGLAGATLPEAFAATVADRGDAPALVEFGTGRTLTWREYASEVEKVAAGLAGLGVRRGETVAILMPNLPEFHVIDMAALHLGATPFSVYLTSSPEQITYLFSNAESRVLFTERRFLDTIAKTDTPLLEHVVVVDRATDTDPGPLPATVGNAEVLTLEDLIGRRPEGFSVETSRAAVEPGDVAVLIYTSGTTGAPKGVELTHANLMFVMDTCNQRFPFAVDGAAISYLPTAHAADRVFSHYLATATGWPITTVESAASAMAAVATTRPAWFLGVPRVWEKLRAGLLSQFHSLPEEQRERTAAALAAAERKVTLEQAGEPVPDDLAQAVAGAEEALFAPLRAKLGMDRMALLMTGAAPIAPAVHTFFLALGLPLQEGFGMSETGALGFTNLPTDIRIGKVGLAQPGTEAALAADGELLLRGPHVMRGYRHDPEKTAEAIDADGWLHTGDIATVDDEGWYRIVDRKKELIINAGGKNMSPVNIEGTLKSALPLIGQVCVIGDRRPYNVALIVLDPDAAQVFANENGIADASLAAMAGEPLVKAAIDDAVNRANAQLSRVEQIKAYRLLPTEWLPDSDELTPTMKMKRRVVADKYSDVIDGIYGGPVQ